MTNLRAIHFFHSDLPLESFAGIFKTLCIMAVYNVKKNQVCLAIDPLVFCKLCLTECPLPDMYQLSDCRCVYCRMCVKQYLEVMIKEGNIMTITCPDAECMKVGKINISEIEELVDKSTYDRYTRLRFQREVDLDPHRMWCPEAGCETICHVCGMKGEPNNTAQAVDCPKCGLKFCSVCKSKWHAAQSCDDHLKTQGREMDCIPFNAIPEDAQIKRCPMCYVPIERNDGCAQMMCKRCKHVFCWYCLASLDDDFLLWHYDRGPCKNKLGHSRASVIWHRTQVVGIFAGFGVFLLLASPILLLAAPCILCCKCKVCKCCDEEDAEPMST